MKFLVLIFLISRWSVSRWSVHLDGGRLVGGRWSVGWLVGGPWQVVSWSVVLRKPDWRLVVSETRKEAITRMSFQKDILFLLPDFFQRFRSFFSHRSTIVFEELVNARAYSYVFYHSHKSDYGSIQINFPSCNKWY